jgi:hypothetical protein
VDAAKGVVRTLDLLTRIDPTGLTPGTEVKVGWPRDMAPVSVDAVTGLRTGVGVVAPDAELPSGSVTYDIYGSPEDAGWRERESYLPFTPWGQVPETAPRAVDAAAAQADSPVPEEVPGRAAAAPLEAEPASPAPSAAAKEPNP